jgi:hypothetical protein
MTKLEIAILQLAQAADEFDKACTEAYQSHKKSASPFASGKSQLALQDTVRNFCQTKIFSAGQARAITGAFSAWRPPQIRPVESRPFAGRSGGAA